MTLELRFLPLHLDKEGVGAKTSGSGECPFSDVRSLSTAPLVPPKLLRSRCLRGRVPDVLHIYTQVRRTCSPTCRRTARSLCRAPQPGAEGPAYFLGATP